MKIGLALSGGGVLGVAHIGVLKEIDSAKITLHSIAGTSAGAIVGALYADGGVTAVENFLFDLRDAGLFEQNSFKFAIPDMIFEQVEKSLTKVLRAKKFEDLKIPFYATATDIVTGEVCVLSKGNLAKAVMASAAYPGVFPVQKYEGQMLIDGGITRNLPVGFLKNKGMDFVIGSSLFNIPKLDKFQESRPNRLDAAIRAIAIMQKELALTEMRNCDFCFFPPIQDIGWYSFGRVDEIKEIGERHAKEHIDELISALAGNKIKIFWKTLIK